ncbi:MAG: ABC transporter permease [Alphaproteobacteria bacterium]|jgi:microcin C transport system permease protein|nr:ABC transporter permease [Alphaproteobacteria bacterium]
MNELNKRRWKLFKSHKRGFYSSIIFLFIFTICLFAEIIANDKPVLVYYKNNFYFPIHKSYNETTFGGDFELETDYKDEYIINSINNNGWIITSLIPYSYDTINYDLSAPAPTPPDSKHWLGTDDQGRDVLARLIYGFRISILFGLVLTILSSIIGISSGAIQGYFGGLTDLIFQRFIEIWSGMPVLYLLIIMSSLITPSFWSLLLLMLLFSWMKLVGVVRAEFLRCRELDYVRAARAIGASNFTIMFRHILPNALISAMSFMPFIFAGSITTLTSLDFLGFGLPVGSASLGEMLQQGKNNLHAPWLGISAFLSLAIILSLITFSAEAIRDAYNPRKTLN